MNENDRLEVKVFANGDWHSMPMTSEDAARLIRERDEWQHRYETLHSDLTKLLEEVKTYPTVSTSVLRTIVTSSENDR